MISNTNRMKQAQTIIIFIYMTNMVVSMRKVPRYYNPDDARFLTQDTYRGENTEPSSLHLYAYCANNPINFIDPSGHWAKSIHKKITKWVFKKFKKRLKKVKGIKLSKIKEKLVEGSVWPGIYVPGKNKKTGKLQYEGFHGFGGYLDIRSAYLNAAKSSYINEKIADAFLFIGIGLHTTQDYYAHHMKRNGKYVTKSGLPKNQWKQYDAYADKFYMDYVNNIWIAKGNKSSRYKNARKESKAYFKRFMKKIKKS